MMREIIVVADWEELGGARQMGILQAIESRGQEVFSFSYDPGWLKSGSHQSLDPDLHLFEGTQYLSDNDRPNFGLFLDSSPDRWGRVLMRRREALIARQEGRETKRLGEFDYLLGVHDQQRLGALRFRETTESPFLSDEIAMAAPPWTSLRKLEHASWQLQDDHNTGDPEILEWLNLLIAPGSSIGGARPKAGVRDPGDDLWIAKFPGRNDAHDIGGWEWLTWQLATEAGINVPPAQILKITRSHHTFATRRFDRVAGSGGTKRLHFASAMTLLGYNDGADHTSGASYLELVDFISNHGAEVATDLEELWRRIVFSIAVSNTDDHLRNHGFLLTPRGWRLSPAYDINPDPSGRGLSLNLSEDDNSLSFDLALEIAPFFRLKPPEAEKILNEVTTAVKKWPSFAAKIGLPRAEQEDLQLAFRTST